MTGRKWFYHVLTSALRQRKGRVAVAVLSVGIASTVVVSAVGLSSGIRRLLGGELKAYGANMIVSKKGGHIDAAMLDALKGIAGIEEFSPQLYSPVSLNGLPVGPDGQVEMIGMTGAHSLNVSGRFPGEGEVLIGADLRAGLGLKTGDSVKLGGSVMTVSGFVETGGPEDKAVILPLPSAQRLTGLEGKISAVLIRGRPGTLDETAKVIASVMPDADVKTLRQVAGAEESFLRKIELLLALVTVVVVGASAISVSSTMSATVLERLREIGLMKALGGTKKGIGRFYLMEAVIIGAGGGTAGFLTGFVSAQAVSKGAFGSYISMPVYLVPVSIVTGLVIAVAASALPLRAALIEKPSVVLRGE